MVKIITNQNGTKGFNCGDTFIYDPYTDETMRSIVDPKKYYGLTDKELIHFKHLKPKKEKPKPKYEDLVKKLKGMKFFIVRWCGDESSPCSHTVDDPIKFFNEYCYGDDVVEDLKDLTVGERYNVNEMMQDIEILRYE